MERKEYPCAADCGRVKYFEGLCYECRQREVREAYQALAPTETAAKRDALLAAMGEDFYKKPENADFFGLLAYQGISTEKIAEAALTAGVYYPCELYRDASPETRQKLIALLMEPSCQEANHILQCLALAGGEDVLAAFVKLEGDAPRQAPGHWSKSLHVPPSVYAQAGGWTFDEAGERVELNFDRCHPVFPLPNGAAAKDTAVSAASPRAETCPHCGTRLMDILTLDGRDARLEFLDLPGVVRIPVCPQCASMCERILVRYTPDGGSAMELIEPFWDGKKMPDDEYAAMSARKFALSTRPAPLFFARGNDESVITIGGFASWIQDFRYDACPDCGKPMRYFASVPWAALSDWSEGTLYLEICPDCRVIGAFHQQT